MINHSTPVMNAWTISALGFDTNSLIGLMFESRDIEDTIIYAQYDGQQYCV